MIKHHSQNIQNVILRELFTANQSIKIAVAWFTNDLLFQPLLLKLATGVKVDLILNKDEINLSSSIDFNLFVKSGGNLYWNDTNRLMHEKFCIIDDRVVITGSYNWTNKAESNYESISVFTNEEESLRDYKTRFATLSKGFTKQIIQITPQPVINRGKCPVSLPPYTKLKFYHSVNLFQSSNTPILAQEYEGGPYALLDGDTFLPKTAFIFSDYSSFVPGRNFLWVRGETKWGLFDCDKLEFVVKPQFDKVDDGYGYGKIVMHQGLYGVISSSAKILVPCMYECIVVTKEYFIVKRNELWGILDGSGREILPCVYSQITDKEPYFVVHTNNKKGVLFKHNNDFIAPQYDRIGRYMPQKELLVVEQGNCCGAVDMHGKEVIPCEYYDIDEWDDCIQLRGSSGYGLLLCRGQVVFEGLFDSMGRICGLNNLFYLSDMWDSYTIFDTYKMISSQFYDDIVYKKDSEGNEILFLAQHDSDKILHGVYIVSIQGRRIDRESCYIIPYNYHGMALVDGHSMENTYNDWVAEQRLFDCQYKSITHIEILGRSALLFEREYQHNNVISSQYSLYIFSHQYILGGQGKWCSKFSSKSEYGIDVILSHNGNKCRAYLMNQAKELRGCYDDVHIHEGVIILVKNGKYGAYILGQQKYIICEYDRVDYDDKKARLLFFNGSAQDKNIIVELSNK